MNRFIDKVLSGQDTTAEDWKRQLLEAHRDAPSMSPQAFAGSLNAAGENSYQWLASSAANHRNIQTVLDLACGDGFLMPLLQDKLSPDAQLIGLDMSPEELQIAIGRGLPNTRFVLSTADITQQAADSIDAVFCHMALMLMLPVEPVVNEVHRILKTGGMFAGVVGQRGNNAGLFAQI